jgi:hypothetical protein
MASDQVPLIRHLTTLMLHLFMAEDYQTNPFIAKFMMASVSDDIFQFR